MKSVTRDILDKPAPKQYSVFTIQVEQQYNTIETHMSLLLKQQPIMAAIMESLKCTVCIRTPVLDILYTVSCCGQHICHSCRLNLDDNCPNCRSGDFRYAKDVLITDVRGIMATVHSGDLPELR